MSSTLLTINSQVRLRNEVQGVEFPQSDKQRTRPLSMGAGKEVYIRSVHLPDRRLTIAPDDGVRYQLMKTYTKQEIVEKTFSIATQERVPHSYLSRDPKLACEESRYEQNQIVFLNREFKFKTGGSFVKLEKGTKFIVESDPTTKNGQKMIRSDKDGYYECQYILPVPQAVWYQWQSSFVDAKDVESA